MRGIFLKMKQQRDNVFLENFFGNFFFALSSFIKLYVPLLFKSNGLTTSTQQLFKYSL